ncbi:MAG: HD domain-containing protein [bacterium]|nr:HD domain-containing protein [bacterium]
MEERRRIAELRAGERVDLCLVVARKTLQPFRDPARGTYLALWLTDDTGGMPARMWEGAESAAACIEVERPLRVVGLVESYRDTLQLNLERVEPVPEGAWRPEDFLPVSPREPEAVAAELEVLCRSVQDPYLARLLEMLFARPGFRQAYLRAPAAKVIHHAYLGGLADHSLEVVRLALTAAELYPAVDRDLLCCGALLHDVGKLEEYRYDWVIDYTDRGRLLGHTVLGYELIAGLLSGINGFPRERGQRLLHLILSHHGEPSWGAPVVPQTLEAAVVAHADLLSGRTRQFHQILNASRDTGQSWTPYDRTLERYLYVGEPGNRGREGA